MPELIMERPKMSLQMHENLKRFILRERRRKKEEDEQKLREEKKKAEIKTQNLEQNKEQIVLLERKLEDLQLKKRELFNQLKKVLNEETNLKKSTRVSVGQSSVAEQASPLNPLLMYSGHPGHPQLLAPQNSQFSQASPIIPQASQSKPQSPFHLMPSSVAHHMPPQASNFFKYFNQSMPLSPQIMSNQAPLMIPPSSPNSSPHMMSSSPRHNIQSSGNIKRQRSPSPSRSPFNQANLINNQFLFNQSHLMQQRSISPCSIIASSPPPTNFNSPSGSKKPRSNVPQSPHSMGPRPQQSQSAFNSFLNRPPMPNFQSPSTQKTPIPAQTPPGSGSYQLSRGMPNQTPPMPGSIPQGFNHHYLNSLSQEQAKMLLQSQQFIPQSYLGNMANIPMISAAAIAAVAAASGNSHQPSSNSGSGGGSIMTGYSIRNPPNQ